jgi:Plavaka transposase
LKNIGHDCGNTIPKFLNVSAQVQATLAARIYHTCLDIIYINLKLAEKNGITLSDPAGQQCWCHTPLVSWIADLPEQHLLACVLANQSPYTLAIRGQFGDLHALSPCHRCHTLDLIRQACATVQPNSLPEFVKACYALGLNGVHQPFWQDWGNADPPLFLMVNVLHTFHKFFFDHPLKWVINIMGREELDRCMAAIQHQSK